MKRYKMTSMEDSNNYCGLCSEELYPQIIQCSCCEKNFHWECVGVDETIEEEEEWWLCDQCHSWINGSQETNSDSDNSGEFESTSLNRSKHATSSESSGPSEGASSSRSSKTEGTLSSTSSCSRGTSARDQPEVEISSVKDRVTRCVTMEPEISSSIQRMASTTPRQSKSVLNTHPCPRDDANQHIFYGHEVRKFQESCQHLEQVGLSRKQTKPTESNKPKLTSKRRLSPAHDAKSPKFNGNEFNRDPECQAEIEEPKPKDNKSTVATAYELPKQINWIQRQRNQTQSRVISQGKSTFSDSIRKIGKESKSKKYESRSFQKMENQLDIAISSVDKWGPDNQRVQRSMFDEQIDKISLHGNQHEKIRVEVPSLQTTRAPNQSTNDSRILRQLSDRKHTFHQRQSISCDQIESQNPRSKNITPDNGCKIGNVEWEGDFALGRSDFCRERENGRLVFGTARKSNVWRVQGHQKLENSSSSLDNTINSNDLETDRQKVEVAKPENPYHREYSQLVSQRVGEDPGNLVVNEWRQSNDRYGQQLNAIRNSSIRRPTYISEWPQLVVKPVCSTSTCEYLNDLINLVKRSQSRIQEHVPEISKIIQRTSSRHENKLNEAKVIFMVKVSLPSIMIPNRFATWCKIVKSLLYVTRYVSIIYAKGRKSTSPRTRLTCIAKTQLNEFAESRTSKILESLLNFSTEFEEICTSIEPFRRHGRLADSMFVKEIEKKFLIQEKKDFVSHKLEKSNSALGTIVSWRELTETKLKNQEMVRYDNPIASIIWFRLLVHVPCHEFVVDRIESSNNFEIDQKHHHIVNQTHQRTKSIFSIKKGEVQSKHKIDKIEKLYTKELQINRRVCHLPFEVIRYKKSDKFRMASRWVWLNPNYQKYNRFVTLACRSEHVPNSMDVGRWQWISTRFESSNHCFVYRRGVQWPKKKRIKFDNKTSNKVKAKFFCSSIAPKTILEYLSISWEELQAIVPESSPPTTIGSGKLFKVDRWIIWPKLKTLFSWIKPQVIRWTKVTTFVLSNICSRLSFIPLASQRKMPKRSARIVSNEQPRRTSLWKPAHKSAVLDVIQQDDSLAQGLDLKTGGSVRITDSSTDPKFKRLVLVTSILERHEQLNLNSRKWQKVNKQMVETSPL